MSGATSAPPRVFLSSVVDGYAPFRDAAAEGIRRAGCNVVRAEDFAAATASPRTACLDGVRSADAVVLLLGERYGYEAPSGSSVTEEEYAEAKRTHKRIFVFLEDVTGREPRQAELVRRVQDYIGGHWRKTFSQATELTALVQQAIAEADMAAKSAADSAAVRLSAALSRRPQEVQGVVWLQAVWATVRDEDVVDPLHLGESAFQQTVLRLAHELQPPLFRYEEAKRKSATTSRLHIEQGDPNQWRDGRDLVALDLDADGTVSIALNVTGIEPAGHASETLYDMYFIDPDVLRRRLAGAWAFAAAWWQHHDPYARHDPLEHMLALHDVGARYFAKPMRTAGGITVPPECSEDPLLVFDRPRNIGRGELGSPSAEIDRASALLERRFHE